MKRMIFAAMVMMAAGLMAVSCSKSDDDIQPDKEIIEGDSQHPSAEDYLKGTWKLVKILDFPIPINSYEIQGDNFIVFYHDGVMYHYGDFNVVLNGDERRPMNPPFVKYTQWSAEYTYTEGKVNYNVLSVRLGEEKTQYVAYFYSDTSMDLAIFADNGKTALYYRFEKQQ